MIHFILNVYLEIHERNYSFLPNDHHEREVTTWRLEEASYGFNIAPLLIYSLLTE